MTSILKRTVTIAGHTTSISLEEEFWQALKKIAHLKGISVSQLILEIDQQTTSSKRNLSSEIRVFVLQFFYEKNNIKLHKRQESS
ncbi:MAG: ribbon-helix-helix domain-containing protein [Proteobacteria bacterium]|nr:ribbon-helix-helix domain-containing protein [Pseudomonadota bacterium]